MKRKTVTMISTAVVALGCLSTAAAQTDTTTESVESPSAGVASSTPTADATETIPVTVPTEARPSEPATPSESRRMIEEVIVTARRTEESLQDVPVAITSLSAADLQREQINSAQDLQGRIPSLVIGTNSNTRNTETPTIRGQGATASASPGVVIYFAEVPLPTDSYSNGQGGPGKFFDVGSLQVLKGSQGTLFGRNTTGGALLIEPHKPEDSFSASLRAEGSNYGGNGYEGVLNVPLVDNELLLRVAAKYFDREGFTEDVVTGKDYDSKHYWTARFGLTWRPTEGAENYLLGYYTSSKDNGTGTVIQQYNPEGLNYGVMTGLLGVGSLPLVPVQLQPGCLYFDLLGPSANCGQDIADEQAARDNRHVQLSANPNDILKTGGVVNTTNYDLNDQLTLRNIASYSFYQHHFRWDLDGSRAEWADLNAPDDLNSSDSGVFTEELQLQGTALDSRLKFVVGAYYEYGKPQGVEANNATTLFQDFSQASSKTHRSYGPYAQGTYNLGGLMQSLEGLNLTLGGRYTFDYIEGVISDSAGVNFNQELKGSAPTWTAGLDYTIDTTLLYGKISRGYKSGGISLGAADPDHYSFEPEYVTNYELGFKSDFEIGDVPARVNAAVYYTDYTGLQKTGADAYAPPGGGGLKFGGATFNVGEAKIQGFEIETSVKPFDGFTLLANYSYTDGEYEKYELSVGSINPQLDCTGQEIARGNIAELSCIPFQSAPKNQYSVTARYELPPLDIGQIEGSVTYAWTGRQYTSPYSTPEAEPGAWLDDYGLLNASLRWQVFNTDLDLMLYGTNLTDKEYRVSNSNVWNVLYFRNSLWSEPRIIGLQLGYRWGD